MPPALAACHTALVGGYVVEGHVPADVIDQLLQQRPAVVGIAVPGMPAGSPGMETPGQPAALYQILAFDSAGRTRVFATRWDPGGLSIQLGAWDVLAPRELVPVSLWHYA